jgi:hypothetical protein
MSKKEPEDDMFSLDPIFEYKMSEQETKAFKVCLIWMKMCQKVLPDYKYTRMPKNGDPRKCHLFRIVWKLLRETNGILKDEELVLFIRAQLEILQGIKRSNGTHVLIDPICLTGPKAWVRWKVWRKKFEQSSREQTQHRGEEERTPLFKIAQELDRTKAYFARFYEPMPTRDEVKQMVADSNLKRWVTLGKVSPYYVLMSPFVRAAFQHLKIAEYFTGVDLTIYIPDITKESQEAFRVKFPHEFGLT